MRTVGYSFNEDVHCVPCTYQHFPLCREHDALGCWECNDGEDSLDPIYDDEPRCACADCGRRIGRKGRAA